MKDQRKNVKSPGKISEIKDKAAKTWEGVKEVSITLGAKHKLPVVAQLNRVYPGPIIRVYPAHYRGIILLGYTLPTIWVSYYRGIPSPL